MDKANIGCKIGASFTAIFLYADDIILLAPSVHVLQSLVNICESELKFLYMTINAKKSPCMRFGPKHKNVCANVVASGLRLIGKHYPGIWASTWKVLLNLSVHSL